MAKGEVKKISFSEIYVPFQKEYTAIASKRSMPQNATLPDGIAMLIQAVALNCSKLTEPSVAYGEMAKVDKMEESIVHGNLARISNAPFPLVESVIVESDSEAAKGKEFPIKDIATGKIKAKRYTRVKMSQLGTLLTRHYMKSSLSSFKQEPFHKSIVPVSLLRPGKPITLGYGSSWLPLNPREMFLLMIKMIEQGTPFINYRDVEDIFKGPDVGYGYNIRCTNESLASLYQTGKGTFSVTPEIAISKEERTITFRKPPLDGISIDLRDYLKKQIKNGFYKTFTAEATDVKMLGVEVVISNVTLNASPEDVYDEITGDKRNYITTQVVSTNTVCWRSTVNKNGYDEPIFEIDIPHIPDILWTSIHWEVEKVKEDILRRIEEKKAGLWSINLMRKLTYDLPAPFDIREYIHDVLKIPGGESKRMNAFRAVLKTFQFHESVPEDMRTFSDEEISEIFKARSNDVLATMHDSNDWAMIYEQAIQDIANLEREYNDEMGIRDSIKKELEYITRDPNLWRRKSKIYFESVDAVTPRGILIPSKEFDEMNLPVSYFFNNFGVGKSYGRNINILPSESVTPIFSVNATTKDTLYLYTRHQALAINPRDLDNRYSGVGENNFIRGIIPAPLVGEKIMVLLRVGTNTENMNAPLMSYVIVDHMNASQIPFEMIDSPEMGFFSTILGWSYIEPDKYMDMIYPNGIMRVSTNELLDRVGDNMFGDLPGATSVSLADIDMVDNADTEITIPTNRGFVKEVPHVTTLHKAKKTGIDYRSITILGTHYEMYLDGTYIPNPTEMYLTYTGEALDIKKVSLPEYTPIPGADDKKSKNINASLKDLIVTLSEDDRDDYTKVMRIKSFTTSQYKKWLPLKYQPCDDRI